MSEPSTPPLSSRLAQLGYQLLHLSDTPSTNRVAAELGSDGASGDWIVLADGQSAGRGRQGRSWVSPAGHGLYVSFLRRPALSPSLAWAMPLLAGCALHGACVKRRAGVWLKWPNDLYCGQRKLGGILCEMQTRGPNILDSVVLGLGLNLVRPEEGWPEELHHTAGALTSARASSAGPTEAFRELRDDLLVDLAANIRLLEHGLVGQGAPPLIERVRAAMSPMIGRRVRVEERDGFFAAEVVGLSDKGRLMVVDASGQRRALLAGDVHLHGQGGYDS